MADHQDGSIDHLETHWEPNSAIVQIDEVELEPVQRDAREYDREHKADWADDDEELVQLRVVDDRRVDPENKAEQDDHVWNESVEHVVFSENLGREADYHSSDIDHEIEEELSSGIFLHDVHQIVSESASVNSLHDVVAEFFQSDLIVEKIDRNDPAEGHTHRLAKWDLSNDVD